MKVSLITFVLFIVVSLGMTGLNASSVDDDFGSSSEHRSGTIKERRSSGGGFKLGLGVGSFLGLSFWKLGHKNASPINYTDTGRTGFVFTPFVDVSLFRFLGVRTVMGITYGKNSTTQYGTVPLAPTLTVVTKSSYTNFLFSIAPVLYVPVTKKFRFGPMLTMDFLIPMGGSQRQTNVFGIVTDTDFVKSRSEFLLGFGTTFDGRLAKRHWIVLDFRFHMNMVGISASTNWTTTTVGYKYLIF